MPVLQVKHSALNMNMSAMSKQNNMRSLQGPFTSRSPVLGVLLGKPGMIVPALPPEAADPDELVLLLLVAAVPPAPPDELVLLTLDVVALLPAVPLLAAVEALAPAVFAARWPALPDTPAEPLLGAAAPAMATAGLVAGAA
jgi:hypothetical protein